MVHHLKRIALIVLLLLGKPAYAEDTTSSRITIQLETIMKEFWNEARKRKLEHRLDEFANTPKGEQLLARYFGSLQKFLGFTATESDFEDFLDRTKILMGMLRNRRKIAQKLFSISPPRSSPPSSFLDGKFQRIQVRPIHLFLMEGPSGGEYSLTGLKKASAGRSWIIAAEDRLVGRETQVAVQTISRPMTYVEARTRVGLKFEHPAKMAFLDSWLDVITEGGAREVLMPTNGAHAFRDHPSFYFATSAHTSLDIIPVDPNLKNSDRNPFQMGTAIDPQKNHARMHRRASILASEFEGHVPSRPSQGARAESTLLKELQTLARRDFPEEAWEWVPYLSPKELEKFVFAAFHAKERRDESFRFVARELFPDPENPEKKISLIEGNEIIRKRVAEVMANELGDQFRAKAARDSRGRLVQSPRKPGASKGFDVAKNELDRVIWSQMIDGQPEWVKNFIMHHATQPYPRDQAIAAQLSRRWNFMDERLADHFFKFLESHPTSVERHLHTRAQLEILDTFHTTTIRSENIFDNLRALLEKSPKLRALAGEARIRTPRGHWGGVGGLSIPSILEHPNWSSYCNTAAFWNIIPDKSP